MSINRLVVGVVLGAALGGACLLMAADAPPTAPGQNWAILIGAEKYHRASHLKYTVNDVRELASTLKTRGGYDDDHILLMTDDESNARFQPLRTSLMSELPAMLKKPGANDTLLVYFSGHGFRDSNGKLYLAPLDCDPTSPAASGVAVEWLREHIANCPAKFKLLVLDACHSGSEKGDDSSEPGSVAAKDLGDQFRNLEGVVTIASSTADEKSQLWDDKQQSLFSYWLNQGLKGHADETGDSAVDIDELYKYVHRNVTNTAKSRFPRAQTPVRIVRSGTPDVPTVIRLQPHTLRQLLNDIAQQLADGVNQRKMTKVGVLEFTNNNGLAELLGADYGALGKWCADELERRMIEEGGGKFSVVNRRTLQTALKSQGFKLNDLGSPPRLKQLSRSAGGMPALAVGTLSGRRGRLVTIQCKLQDIGSDATVASAGGTAELNESEWAMLGRSAEIPADAHQPQVQGEGVEATPVSTTVIEQADQNAQGPHPLQNPKYPFRTKIMVNGKERVPVFKKVGEGSNARTDCYVPVKVGETYEIWVENRSGGPATMRLLVDGLNTLPEKGEDLKGIETFVWGKRIMNLDEARHWVLDPDVPGMTKIKGIPTWAVKGFTTETGETGKWRLFKVVDADQSLAGRQQFTDQIGMITAAFYRYKGGPRGAVGTAAGDEVTANLRERESAAGDLLSVIHIRYVDAAALNSAAN